MSETTETLNPQETLETKDPEKEKDPYKDLEEISSRIDKCLRADSFSRVFFESQWARNIFFYAGAQWLRRMLSLGGAWPSPSAPEQAVSRGSHQPAGCRA